MLPLIELKEVRKQVDDFNLGPISFAIESGTITAFVGTNGSGKSSLLKLIMNLANPDKGEIRVLGKPVDGKDESWKRHITYLPQRAVGWDAYSGNALKKLMAPLYPQWDETLFDRMISLFGVPLDKRFDKLSPGMQQKLSLSLALPRSTNILILDEPTAALDIPSKKLVMDLIVEWMERENRAIILTTHQPENLRKLADYLLLFQNGKVVGQYVKDLLITRFRRYWVKELPSGVVPGELLRSGKQLISENPEATELYFADRDIDVIDDNALELEEIISLLLQ